MSHALYQAIFKVAQVLELPVIVVALLALATVVFEFGAFLVELWHRRRRRFEALSTAARAARVAVDRGDVTAAIDALEPVAWSAGMAAVMRTIAEQAGRPGADTRIAKEMADFDFDRQRRLGRTRLLVRMGPALGLMGTLIPLTPALDGLAHGNVTALTDNLRVAFSVTVLGLFIGAVAFGLSLSRDRIYGQDYSDLEYVAAVLTEDAPRLEPTPVEAEEVGR